VDRGEVGALGPALPLPVHGRAPAWWRGLRRLRGGLVGAVVVAAIVAMSVLAPWLAPHNPYVGRVVDRLLLPVWMDGGTAGFPLGTDQIGRDVLSRLLYAGRVSLTIAALAVTVAGAVGFSLGLLAGFYGGWLDWTISAAVDVMLTFPFVLLALATIAVLGPGLRNIVIVLGITGWPIYTRVVRAEVIRLGSLEFIEAARAIGLTNARILVRHIVPNLLNAVIVIASLDVARFIIVEAFLSYLGLGVDLHPRDDSGATPGGGGCDYFATTFGRFQRKPIALEP